MAAEKFIFYFCVLNEINLRVLFLSNLTVIFYLSPCLPLKIRLLDGDGCVQYRGIIERDSDRTVDWPSHDRRLFVGGKSRISGVPSRLPPLLAFHDFNWDQFPRSHVECGVSRI